MGRIKNTDNFGKRSYESDSLAPKSIYIISVEGNRTEYDYFTFLNDCKEELGINSLIKVSPINRIDTKSSPRWVYNLLEEYRDEYGVTEIDKLWMVIDRDEHNNPEHVISNIIDECEKSGFKIAITNPCFELWLFFHCISSLDGYDKEKLKLNPKKSAKAKRRYIELLLIDINGTYNKKKLKKEFYIERSKIMNAIRLEYEVENDPRKIIDSLGSNIGDLVKEIMKS